MGTLYLIRPAAEFTREERLRSPTYVDRMEEYGNSIGAEELSHSGDVVHIRRWNWSREWLIPLKRRE